MASKAVMAEGLEANARDGWVMLMPVGGIAARDGRRFIMDDAARVVAVSQPRKGGPEELPVDYEHQSEEPTKGEGGPKPAAGWITELEARPEGIFGKVRWTDRAAAMIASRKYRFLSPAFLHSPSGDVQRIVGAGLTHRPALELTALASEQGDTPVPDVLARLTAAAGLAEGTGEGELIAFCRAARDTGREPAPDPARFMPVEAVIDLLKDRQQHIDTLSERDAEAKVDASIMEGRITPGMRSWAMALCRSDAGSFDTFLATSAAPYAHLFRQHGTGMGASPMQSTARMDEAEAAICCQLGIKAFTA